VQLYESHDIPTPPCLLLRCRRLRPVAATSRHISALPASSSTTNLAQAGGEEGASPFSHPSSPSSPPAPPPLAASSSPRGSTGGPTRSTSGQHQNLPHVRTVRSSRGSILALPGGVLVPGPALPPGVSPPILSGPDEEAEIESFYDDPYEDGEEGEGEVATDGGGAKRGLFWGGGSRGAKPAVPEYDFGERQEKERGGTCKTPYSACNIHLLLLLLLADLAVIGGGSAGLSAAAFAASTGELRHIPRF
jgi:hypothetical protein